MWTELRGRSSADGSNEPTHTDAHIGCFIRLLDSTIYGPLKRFSLASCDLIVRLCFISDAFVILRSLIWSVVMLI